MKNFVLLAIMTVAILFSGCKDDDNESPKGFEIDTAAMIYIKADQSVAQAPALTQSVLKSDVGHLTPLEIVKQATGMRFFNAELNATTGAGAAMGFAGRDSTSEVPAFLRYGTDIINLDGFGKPYLVPDLIYAYDCVIEIFYSNTDIDTIAYIPNAILREAEANIKAALEAKDTAAVYGIFNNAFKFIPITGSEYIELKRQGLN